MPYKKHQLKNAVQNLLLFCALIIVCAASVFAQQNTVEIEYNFHSGAQGWTADFADYPPNIGTGYELDAGIRWLPRKLTRKPQRGFYVQGHNRSADLFMFLKRRLGREDGIVANRIYRVEYVITLASNAASNCVGIGGAR